MCAPRYFVIQIAIHENILILVITKARVCLVSISNTFSNCSEVPRSVGIKYSA